MPTRAYDDIKEKILTLYFLPGQYLNEGAICALLDVGRTPVHQALHRLQHEGLVEIMPRKGVIVQPDSIGEIIKNPRISRVTVEAELARNAAEHATAAGGRGAEGAGARHRSRRAGAGNRRLHRRRPRLSPQLAELVRQPGAERLRPQAARALEPLLVSASVADHRRATANDRQHGAIADAIKRQATASAAADAVRRHIAGLRPG